MLQDISDQKSPIRKTQQGLVDSFGRSIWNPISWFLLLTRDSKSMPFTRKSKPKGIERSVILIGVQHVQGIDVDHVETQESPSIFPHDGTTLPDGEGDRNLGLATISRTGSRT